jgi:hypothetical protein
MKVEITGSLETLVPIYKITRRHIQQDEKLCLQFFRKRTVHKIRW